MKSLLSLPRCLLLVAAMSASLALPAAAVTWNTFNGQAFIVINDLATGNCIYIPLDADSAPGDWIAANDRRTYADMITPAGLADIAKYANGKLVDFNGDGAVNEADGTTIKNSNLVADAHTAGLFVHPYTFRTDVVLARNYAGGGRSNASAINAEYRQMWSLGVDGLFSDFPDDAFKSRALFATDQVDVVEYANAADANVATRFFRTATDADIRAVAAVEGLTRTTDSFKAWSTLQTGALATTALCRYFDSKNSRHLYSIDITQCSAYAAAGYSNEGTAFQRFR